MDMQNGRIDEKPVDSVRFAFRNQQGKIIGYTKPISHLGRVGQTVNIEPRIARYLPEGYSLSDNRPIDVKLTGDSLMVLDV